MKIEKINSWDSPLVVGLITIGLLISVFVITGCDEGMNMTNGVITEPTEPEPTVAIAAAAQQDDGSITVSGTSTDVPKGTTVTVTLGENVTTT